MTTAFAVQIRYDVYMSKRSLDNLSDEALLARIADRDESAFETLIRRFLQWAHRFDMRFLQNCHDAEDAVQEKFLRIWRKADTYEPLPGSKVTNFLLKIDKNICLDMLRRSYRQHELPVSGNPVFDEIGEAEVLDYLEYRHLAGESSLYGNQYPVASLDLMERIYTYTREHFNRRQFLVFWGFVSGMSYKELATTYAMQPGSVRGYVARGFAAVRQEFGTVRRDHD